MIERKNLSLNAIELIIISLLLFGCANASSTEKSTEDRKSGSAFIAKLDKDSDNKVSESEFPGPSEHFQEFDKNDDGYIDEDEAPTKRPSRRR